MLPSAVHPLLPSDLHDQPQAARASAPDETAPTVANQLAHILIVDNDSRDGWMWASALRGAGFRMSIAADTHAGWHALDGHAFALLIASHNPTGRTGLDLIEKLRNRSDRLPCILVWDTDPPDDSTTTRVLQPGVALRKPITIQQLLAAVRRLLGGCAGAGLSPIAGVGSSPRSAES